MKYERFIKPSELAAWARSAQLEVMQLAGLSYYPSASAASSTSDVSVNYMAHPAARSAVERHQGRAVRSGGRTLLDTAPT